MPCAICGQHHAPGVACPTPAAQLTAEPAAPVQLNLTATPTPTETAPPTPAATVQVVQPARSEFSLEQIEELTGLGLSFERIKRFAAAGVPFATVKAFTPDPEPAAVAPPAAPVAERTFVNPAALPVPGQPAPHSGVQVTREALPYRFHAGQMVSVYREAERNGGEVPQGAHSFAADVLAMRYSGDEYGATEAGRRVLGALRRFDAAIRGQFATTQVSDVNELMPTLVRPLTATPAYRTPLWAMIDKGAPPNGVQPFLPPVMSSSTTAAPATHTEGTEPTPTKYVTTGSAITPTAISGKVNITREAWDTIPNLDALVWDELTKQYAYLLETGAATHIATNTAAANIALDGLHDDKLADQWISAYIQEQTGRAYDFSAFAVEPQLYKELATARSNSGAGELIFPAVGPTNTIGTVTERYGSINLNGVQAVMAPSLGTANSWLFDPAYVSGWATGPMRLSYGTGSDNSNASAPVAFLDVAIWGYRAYATLDTAAVREVTYNNAS